MTRRIDAASVRVLPALPVQVSACGRCGEALGGEDGWWVPLPGPSTRSFLCTACVALTLISWVPGRDDLLRRIARALLQGAEAIGFEYDDHRGRALTGPNGT